MFLLLYRTLKHKTITIFPSELYLNRDLRLPLDLIHVRLPYEEDIVPESYASSLREILNKIHVFVQRLGVRRSEAVKCCYDRKARLISF